MTLTIQAGKYYRTRDGRKVGPMLQNDGNPYWPWIDDLREGTGSAWDASGKGCICTPQAVFDQGLDLVAEWTDETGGSAFPQMVNSGKAIIGEDGSVTIDKEIVGGMTLRQYAAIKLRVPDSGLDWLDDMIRRTKRDNLAGRAPDPSEEELNLWKRKFANSHNGHWPSDIVAKSALSYQYADIMLAEPGK